MAMHDKYYDNEDVNTKFIRSLPEMYDEETTTIREANDLDEITLEDVYGKLRAYELEWQQRKGRSEGKTKFIDLIFQDEKEKSVKDHFGALKRKEKKKVPSESESSDTDSDSEEKGSEADMKEIMAMFARSFRKGKFKRRRFSRNFLNKDEDQKINRERSKFVKLAKAKIKCFNCNEQCHFASECKKPRNLEKGKSLMTTQKD